MELTRVIENLPELLSGAVTTLELSALGIALASALGMCVGLMRVSPHWILWASSRVFVDVIRGTPLLIQLYILYYGFPSLGVTLDAFTAAVIALGVNSAAYIAEIVRAALQSIPQTQIESARALGMSYPRTLRRIVIPQALGVAIPPLTNEFIDIVKWSSVAAMVVVSELTQVFYTTVGRTFYFIELFIFVTLFYFVVTTLLSVASRKVERYATRYRSAP